MRAERNHNDYYVSGNTVRKLHTAPSYQQEQDAKDYGRLRERQQREQQRIEWERKQREHERARRRRLEKSRSLDLKMLLALTGALVAVFVLFIGYLEQKNSIISMDKKVAGLERTIMEMKDENSAIRDSKKEELSLEQVYQIATQSLGMVHPTENQVISYDSELSEYFKQYGDIPGSEKSDSRTPSKDK